MKRRKPTGNKQSSTQYRQGPIRTCAACGQKNLQMILQRYAVDHLGKVVEDNQKTIAGRGAYCCNIPKCRDNFLGNKKKIARVFRLTVNGKGAEIL